MTPALPRYSRLSFCPLQPSNTTMERAYLRAAGPLTGEAPAPRPGAGSEGPGSSRPGDCDPPGFC